MPNDTGSKPSGEPSHDSRLRYSRRAMLVGLLGAGALVGFRNPLELLRQPTEGAGSTGAPATERTVKSASEEHSKPERGQEPAEAGNGKAAEDPPPPQDPTLTLYVPRLGIQGHTVREGSSESLLALGAMKLPSTGFPWQGGANSYIAGHRIGYPGRESYYQFYNLPAMRFGDPVYLRDANWSLYEYRLTEKFAVSPSESWVTDPIKGRDLVTLQTCVDSVAQSTWWYITPKLMQAGPDTGRLIVRAERV